MWIENKQRICNFLTIALQETRQYRDLLQLKYEKESQDEETVTAVFTDGNTVRINVSMDSGAAMVRDITRALR